MTKKLSSNPEKSITRRSAKRVDRQAKKVAAYGPKATTSFRRNVLPIIAGLSVMILIMAALNGQLLVAQWHYHFDKPVAASSATAVSADPISTTSSVTYDTTSPHPELGPQVTIPSINVNAPVIFEQGTAEWQIQVALRSGVVHYGNSVSPGQIGNVVLFGHSSGQPWAPGKYKFVFTLLEKVNTNDLIYIDNGGTRFTYKVTSSQVIAPTDTGVLTSGTDHELTLITCTPVGTSKDRLVVHAEQISPDSNTKPVAASTAAQPASKPAATSATTPTELPGSAHQSFWQSLRDLF